MAQSTERDLLQEGFDLVDEMTTDELSSLVDYIRGVFKSKRQQDNARALATLKVGDRVRLSGTYKPQYLNGLTGVVKEKKQTRIVVTLDRGPVGKFRTGNVVTTAGGLTKLEEKTA
jgi:hypothetical protein